MSDKRCVNQTAFVTVAKLCRQKKTTNTASTVEALKESWFGPVQFTGIWNNHSSKSLFRVCTSVKAGEKTI